MSPFIQKKIRTLVRLASSFADESTLFLDKFHQKREQLQHADLALSKVQVRHDQIAAERFMSAEIRDRHLKEINEELDDAKNRRQDIIDDQAAIEERRAASAADRDRARKLAQSLMDAAETTHEDLANPDAGWHDARGTITHPQSEAA